MLLVYPPMAKACEPPAGLARLAGSLNQAGLACTLLDANLEGQLYLLNRDLHAKDTWSKRAIRNRAQNLEQLRRSSIYASPDRYQRAVRDLNRAIEQAGKRQGVTLSLANYHDGWRPTDSGDLWAAAAHWQDNLFAPWFTPRLERLIKQARPPLIGFSLTYLHQAATTFAMIGMVRDRWPSLPIVLGGGLVTSWLHGPLTENPFPGLVDHLIAGPGEAPLLKLLGATGTPAPPDFDDLPLADYLAPGLILPYAASSGCFWGRCRFCPETAEQSGYRQLDPDQAHAELTALIDRYRPNLVHLLDNAVSPALLQRLAAAPIGVPWYGFARLDAPLLDAHFCRRLAAQGCTMLKLGLESGDQGVLDTMDKGIDLDKAAQVLVNLASAGIATYVYLLFGTPAEELTAARRTLDFVVRHRSAISFLNLAIFNLPAGSPEAESLAVTDLYEGDLSLYRDFRHPLGWDRREIRLFLDREFRAHPEIRRILQRDPPHYTSNHAALLLGDRLVANSGTDERSRIQARGSGTRLHLSPHGKNLQHDGG